MPEVADPPLQEDLSLKELAMKLGAFGRHAIDTTRVSPWLAGQLTSVISTVFGRLRSKLFLLVRSGLRVGLLNPDGVRVGDDALARTFKGTLPAAGGRSVVQSVPRQLGCQAASDKNTAARLGTVPGIIGQRPAPRHGNPNTAIAAIR